MLIKKKITTEELHSIARYYASEEGTLFFHSEQNSILALFPKEKFIFSSWDRFKQTLSFNGNPLPQYLGFITYEMGATADEDLKLPFYQPLSPLVCFYEPSVIFCHNKSTNLCTIQGPKKLINESLKKITSASLPFYSFKIIQNGTPKEHYYRLIEQTKEWIRKGEVYQLNLSHEFILKGKAHPYSVFEALYNINPSPFSAFIQLGEQSIISSSPERFLSCVNSIIETRPIKGTCPRGKTKAEDEKLRLALLNSEKDRAELLMITDLMRNDLSKICTPTSVITKELWRCESFTNVHHLLSIIQGEKNKNINPIDLIRKCFPGGSITGCPKLKALEKIHILEQRPRGVYTGSIGYFTGTGDFDFNIAIRTIVQTKNIWNIQLGGAIVIDSDPETEYKETFYKGKSMFMALNNG
jgi:para-aminobenzoate synthetase component I